MNKLLKKLIISIGFILFINSFTFSTHILANNQSQESYLIIFKDNKVPTQAVELLKQKYKSTPISVISEIGALKVETTSNLLIKELKKDYKKQIQYIGPETKLEDPRDFKIKKQFLIRGNVKESKMIDSSLSEHSIPLNSGELSNVYGWDTDKITNNGESYKKQPGNSTIKVALIDSGVDFSHPDIKDNIVSKGKSFVPGVTDTEDRMGHGTMTAGAIAANGKLLGVGPKLGIVPYKVMDNWIDGAESTWVISAIIQAANDNMDVINLSLGTYKSLNKQEDAAIIEGYNRAIKYAYKKGSIIVASAGNEGYDTRDAAKLALQMGLEGDKQIHLPGGNSQYLLNVSATNKQDELSSYSNFGSIDLAAPAGDYGEYWASQGILDPSALTLVAYPTTLPEPYINQVLNLPRGYTLSVGTSLAAPKVSGAVGVILAENQAKGHKKIPMTKVKNILKRSATDLGPKGKDDKFGYGLLNLDRAIDLVH
ncbi:S8 family serine peptidase [Priestia megaterium]|uniref:S8 family serine peptidase n=1 Tax=Priestia megaterium TaxID=1404 RepID=UPI0025712799|nr:S8 family serine peptidase [Priestia megaterium]WJD83666.1 S8 family serine peptidase [Priestia megaterium]